MVDKRLLLVLVDATGCTQWRHGASVVSNLLLLLLLLRLLGLRQLLLLLLLLLSALLVAEYVDAIGRYEQIDVLEFALVVAASRVIKLSKSEKQNKTKQK